MHDSEKYGNTVGFLMADIDRFKEINDRFGHFTGDKILSAVADLITDAVKNDDIVVRYGGDEFLIILPDSSLSECETVKQNILKKAIVFNKENNLVDFGISLSIGVSIWNRFDEKTPEEILNIADDKMYQTKRIHKDNFKDT
jgi:diguanylate cyclase (GGDEF)-like protein